MVANSESNKSRACIVVCYGCKQRVQQVKSLYSGLLWLQTASPTSQEPYSGLLWLQTASPTSQEPYSGLLWLQTASPTSQEPYSGLLWLQTASPTSQEPYSGLLWLQTASPTSQEPYSGLLWLQTASPTSQEPYSGLLWFQTASPTTQENNGLLVVAVGESIDDGVWCIQRQFLESVVWMRWREFLRPTNRVLRHIHSITPLSLLPFFYGWLCLMSSDTPLIDAGGGGGVLMY